MTRGESPSALKDWEQALADGRTIVFYCHACADDTHDAREPKCGRCGGIDGQITGFEAPREDDTLGESSSTYAPHGSTFSVLDLRMPTPAWKRDWPACKHCGEAIGPEVVTGQHFNPYDCIQYLQRQRDRALERMTNASATIARYQELTQTSDTACLAGYINCGRIVVHERCQHMPREIAPPLPEADRG